MAGGLPALAALLLVAGYNTDYERPKPAPPPSADQLEGRIETELLRPVGIGGQADCPSPVMLDKGDRFTCSVTVGDRKAKVDVTKRGSGAKLTHRVRRSGR